ncbi:MAG: glycosyltransferase family A protein, partial [Pseudomonadota bacterium]
MQNEATPQISVIIPARNAGGFIGETLAALSSQDAAFECIVVNDGSSDSTPDVVAQHSATDPRITLIQGPAQGVSAARNMGLAQTAAPWVLFLDADDLLTEGALTRFLSAAKSTPVAALGGVARIAEDGAPLPGDSNLALVPEADHLTALLRKNFVVNGGALLIRRSIIEAVGGYDTTLAYGEDWEFWCRLAERGDFATLSQDPVLLYRQMAGGANYKARGSVFARNVPCLAKIAENPSIRARLGGKLKSILRARQIDIFWSGVRSEFQFGTRSRALTIALGGLFLYPDSVARPQLALRFL